MTDLTGWALVPTTFLLLGCFSELRKDRRALAAACLVLLPYHLVAFTHYYVHPVQWIGDDAGRFHRDAVLWAQSGQWTLDVGSSFFIQFLGSFYRFMGASAWAGAQLAILAAAASLGVLSKLTSEIGIKKDRWLLVVLIGAMPSSVIFGSSILRESFQLLFLMAAVYGILRFGRTGQIQGAVLAFASALVLSFLHHGLLLVGVMLIMLLPFAQALLGEKKPWWRAASINPLILLGGGALVILGGLWLLTFENAGGFEVVHSIISGDALEYVRQYRNRLLTMHAGRADYGIPLNVSSITGILESTTKIYLYYLFAPFPWMIKRWIDIYAAAESIFRLTMIGAGGWHILHAKGSRRRMLVLLAFLFAGLSFLWSLGTANYGTSIRHHVTTNWILILLGAPFLLANLRGWRKDASHGGQVER